MVVAFAVGGLVGTKNIDPNTSGPGQSGRMDRILDSGFKLPANESVLVQSRSVQAGAPAFDAAVADVVARVSKLAAVQNVGSPKIANDRHSALVEFEIRGDKEGRWQEFYAEAIPLAERLYEEHLDELRREGAI